jgi:methanogenic corrinoid protein MtbC1
MCADGNYHTLGIRALALSLDQAGLRNRVLYPGLPPTEAIAWIDAQSPKAVGFSVSLQNQRDGIEQIIHHYANRVDGPELFFLGGNDVKYHPEHWQRLAKSGVDIVEGSLQPIIGKLAQLIKLKPAA